MQSKGQNKFKKSIILIMLAAIGPGMVVMLADTDAGSVITAAQSGAEWGYQLLLIQFILIPILYITQELTVRLGACTGKGHGELIKEHFGKTCAWISVSTMLVTCVGAILTEFSGLAGVGLMFGVPKTVTLTIVVLFLISLIFTRSYKSVEKIALLIGAFEVVFFIVAWEAKPQISSMASGLLQVPIENFNYLYLMAANIGAVIMPWMIFYQQSAVVDKKLTEKDIKMSRWDTAIGSIITQLIMAAILVATAATLYKAHDHASLNSVGEISQAITPYLGHIAGVILFSLGMVGAAMIAAIVVTLTASYGSGEVVGFSHSLQNKFKDALPFYLIYIIMLIGGALLVCSNINLINLSVGVEVLNALCLPIVLGFLYLLARKALPEKYKLKGTYGVIVLIILAATSIFAFVAGIAGIF